MRYVILVCFLVLSVGCGKLPDEPESPVPNIRAASPSLTLCSVAEDAAYCADGGLSVSQVPGVPNGAVIGLFSAFQASPSLVNVYGRLVEMADGVAGGANLTVSNNGSGGINVDCSWWGVSTRFVESIGSPDGVGDFEPHNAYCEIGSNYARLYVDGILVRETLTAVIYYTQTDGDIYVGAAYNGSNEFNGSIDSVAVFTHALDLSAIATISR